MENPSDACRTRLVQTGDTDQTGQEIDPSEHVDLFKALANETRIAILAQLFAVEEACVCELMPVVDASQSTVSGHLAKLRDLGIVTSRREGRMVIYRLTDPAVERIFQCLTDE